MNKAGLIMLPLLVALPACHNRERAGDDAAAGNSTVSSTDVSDNQSAMSDTNSSAMGDNSMLSGVDNGASNALDDVKTALTTTPTPQDFVNRAAASDAFEIAAAKLAESKGQSPEVKRFAAEMIKDHKASTAKIKAAASASKPAITPSDALSQDQQSQLDTLNGLSGNDFDKRYMSGQIGAHRDALALMQRYAKDGTNTELKTTAGKIVPVIQHHLDMARGIKVS